MVQKVRIGFDSVAKPFTLGYTFFHVHLHKFLLYLNLVKIQIKEFCFLMEHDDIETFSENLLAILKC